jgi:hypothetical protein
MSLTRDRLAVGLMLLGLAQLASGLFMAAFPGAFYEHWAAFGPRNDHYIRDVATINLALGAALLVAIARPRWRPAVIAVAALQSALHTISHIADLDEPHSHWQGPLNLALVGGGTLLLFLMWWASERVDRP